MILSLSSVEMCLSTFMPSKDPAKQVASSHAHFLYGINSHVGIASKCFLNFVDNRSLNICNVILLLMHLMHEILVCKKLFAFFPVLLGSENDSEESHNFVHS